MKKLVIVSTESVFSGCIRSGMAEMTDSMANALSTSYAVTVICHNENGVMSQAVANLHVLEEGVKKCRLSAVDYLLVEPKVWKEKVVALIDQLHPDILHNMSEPSLIAELQTRPQKAIYTFDQAQFVRGKEEYLRQYDSVTTSSVNYAKEVLAVGDELADTLSNINFSGITAGILDTVLAPEKGLLIPARYSAKEQAGKQICKKRLLDTYHIKGDPYICLMMCRLIPEKGIERVFEVVKTIKDTGGVLVVVGRGEEKYEKQLKNYTRDDGVVFVDNWASPMQAAPLTAGADFYLSPSVTEACGLMPMTASRYGAIPIVTQNGGLADNFNAHNAIVINNDLASAIRRASVLYSNKKALEYKRRTCMEQDFSWATRKEGYIKLYED